MDGVQLTANDLLRVGDWIEMPQFNADGDVIDIALNVVKVQNWDKTITVIPAHKFIENSFKNWRGMQESGWFLGRCCPPRGIWFAEDGHRHHHLAGGPSDLSSP